MVARVDLNVVLRATNQVTPTLRNIESSIIRFVGAISASLAAIRAISFPVAEAVALDRALRDVQKTTAFTDRQIQQLSGSLVELSETSSLTATELANIAAQAGQLGLGGEGVEGLTQFTNTIQQAVIALDLSVDEAGRATGRLLDVFGLQLDQADQLLSTVNELSNTTTATAREIVDVVQRVGPLAGLSAQEVAALGTTAVQLGVSTEVAGTTLVKVFTNVQSKAQEFADATGRSLSEFQSLPAFERFQTFLQALAEQSESTRQQTIAATVGTGRFAALINKFVEDIADGQSLLAENLQTSNIAFEDGTSLQAEYANVSRAVSEQFRQLQNVARGLAIDVGNQLLPVIRDAIASFRAFLDQETTRQFFLGFGRGLRDAAEATVRWVQALNDLDIVWENVIQALRLFVGFQIVRIILAAAAATALWATRLAVVLFQLTGITRLLPFLGAALTRTSVAAFTLSGALSSIATFFARAIAGLRVAVLALLTPLGLLGAAVVAVGAAVTFVFREEIVESLRNAATAVLNFFGFVTEEQAAAAREQRRLFAEQQAALEQTAATIQRLQRDIASGDVGTETIDLSEIVRTEGFEAAQERIENASQSILRLQEGIESALLRQEAIAGRIAATRELQVQAADQVQSAERELAEIRSNFTEEQIAASDSLQARIILLERERDLAIETFTVLRNANRERQAGIAEAQAAAAQFQVALENQLQSTLGVLSAEGLQALRVRIDAREARDQITELETQLRDAGERLATEQSRLSGTLDAGETAEVQANIAAATAEVARLENQVAEANERAQELQQSFEDSANALPQAEELLVRSTEIGETTQEVERFADALRTVEPVAIEARQALQDAWVTSTADLLIQQRALEANKAALEEQIEPLLEIQKAAKAAVDNTTTELRAFNRQVIEGVAELNTELQRRPIDIQLQADEADLAAREQAIADERERIVTTREQQINDARSESEEVYFRNRLQAELEAVEIEERAVADRRVALQEERIRNEIALIENRTRELVEAAEAAARRGDLEEALGLKDLAKRAIPDALAQLDQLAALTTTDTATGEIIPALNADEIGEAVAGVQQLQQFVGEAIPDINQGLLDSVEGTLDPLEAELVDVTSKLKDLGEALDVALSGLSADQRTALTGAIDDIFAGRAAGVGEGVDPAASDATQRALIEQSLELSNNTDALAEFRRNLQFGSDATRREAAERARLNAEIRRDRENNPLRQQARGVAGGAIDELRARQIAQIQAATPPELQRLEAAPEVDGEQLNAQITAASASAPAPVVEVDIVPSEASISALQRAVNFVVDALRRPGTATLVDPLATGGVRGATGGMVRGPGTSLSDSVPAMLSAGEYVMNAQTVRRFGAGFFSSLQSIARRGMDLPGFAVGGPVSSLPAAFEPVVAVQGAGGAPVHIHLPGGETVKLREGESDRSETVRIFAKEARKRGVRVKPR